MRNRLAAFTALALTLSIGASCTASNGGDSTPAEANTATGAGSTGRTTTTLPLDTPTTFIRTCGQMPDPAELSAIVGFPLADGQVIAAGSCQFNGLNEQSRTLTLTLLTDPLDQATFIDLQASLGPSTPLEDPTLVGAMVDPTSLVYVTIDGAIYAVRALVTDAAANEQVPLAVAVLHLWLGV